MFDFLNSGEEAPQQGSVGGFLNPDMDPVSQAFLLNAGLRMLAGGWGHPATKVAGALSSGLEAAGGAAQIEDQQRRADTKSGQVQQELDQRLQMHREDIGSREKIAKMYADQRLESSKLRSGGVDRTTTEWHKNRRAFETNHAYDPKYLDAPEQLLQDAIDAADQVDAAAAAKAAKTSPNSGSAAPPVGPPGAEQTPGKTSPNSGPQSAVTPRQSAPYSTPFAPRGQPVAAQPAPATGGVPFSQVITDPKTTPEARAIFMRLNSSAGGRAQLRAKGINPDG